MKNKELNDLVELCRFYGERADLVQGPGGNISVKTNDGLMLIKASGCALSSVSDVSNTVIYITELAGDVKDNKYRPLEEYSPSYSSRASMETYMHSFLYKYVVHLHPIQVNSILVQKDARKICQELFPTALFLDYVTPGVKLAKKLKKEWNGEQVILLANHGIVVTLGDLSGVKKLVKQVLKTCEEYLGTSFDKYENVNKISSLISNLTGESCVTYCSEVEFSDTFVFEESGSSLFPDKVIFCGSKFLICDKLNKETFQKFIHENGCAPKVIRYDSETYFTGKSLSKCRDAEAILLANANLYSNSILKSLTAAQENELVNMESEKYRSKL